MLKENKPIKPEQKIRLEAAKEMESDMHPQLTLNMEAQVLFFPQKQKLHS